tara:strand:+ start:710 stop:901 length:192 start_codon:yes stop_codon:yes gene_type:complete
LPIINHESITLYNWLKNTQNNEPINKINWLIIKKRFPALLYYGKIRENKENSILIKIEKLTLK